MAWKECMHIKKTTHLLTFLHTAYYEGSNFRFLYRGARREFRQSSDKPPPARSEIDGRFLYVYAAVPSLLQRGKGRFLGCQLKKSFVRCRSPPKTGIQEILDFLEELVCGKGTMVIRPKMKYKTILQGTY